MIYHLKEYASVKEYAALCNIKSSGIYDRIYKKKLPAIKIGDTFYIDVLKNKPVRSRNVPKSKWVEPNIEKFNYKEDEQRVYPVIKNLKSVSSLAEKLLIRSDSIFEKVISNKIDGFVFCGVTYIDIKANILASLRKKRFNQIIYKPDGTETRNF